MLGIHEIMMFLICIALIQILIVDNNDSCQLRGPVVEIPLLKTLDGTLDCLTDFNRF